MGHSVSSLESATEKHPNSILWERLRTEETWKGTKSAQWPTLARCTMVRFDEKIYGDNFHDMSYQLNTSKIKVMMY